MGRIFFQNRFNCRGVGLNGQDAYTAHQAEVVEVEFRQIRPPEDCWNFQPKECPLFRMKGEIGICRTDLRGADFHQCRFFGQGQSLKKLSQDESNPVLAGWVRREVLSNSKLTMAMEVGHDNS